MAKNQGRGQKLQQLEPFCTRCPHFTVVIFSGHVCTVQKFTVPIPIYGADVHMCKAEIFAVFFCGCAVCLKLGSDFVSVSHTLCRSPGFGCQRLPGDGAALRHSVHPPRSRADAVDEGSGKTLYHPHRQLLWQKGEKKKRERHWFYYSHVLPKDF